MKDKKICVLGGDSRQVYAAHEMYKNDIDISVYGLGCKTNDIYEAKNLKEAIISADTILLPLPFSADGIRVFSPLSKHDIKLDELLTCISEKQTIIGGKFSGKFLEKAKQKGIKLFDFYNSERLTALNALPTAEGAVSLAMQELKTTIYGSKCAVFGFGRIAKILSKILKNLGAEVTVIARSTDALTWAEIYGYNPIHISKAKDYISDKDVIFNTIPSLVLTNEIIDCVSQDSLIIDLASYPGGVDFDYAKLTNKKVIFALSLPGKYAPKTAGKIIADTVISYIKGEKL